MADEENQVNQAIENSLREKLDGLTPMTDSRCIHRVPCRLRDVRKKAYTPRGISIGPFHHKNQSLKPMEEHKMRYLEYFLHRPNARGLMHYIETVRNQEAVLRSYYSETIPFNSDQFVKIILVDAIFLIEYLFRNRYPTQDGNDCFFGVPKRLNDVWIDLLLLENQLPFFILSELFDRDMFQILNGDENRLSMLFLAHYFLTERGICMATEIARVDTVDAQARPVQHLVDLLRRLYVAHIARRQELKGPPVLTAPSIERLHKAGVKLMVGPNNNNIFDIRFEDGVLNIPKLQILNTTQAILRNLVAFEQLRLLPGNNYVTDFVWMLDQLVDTPEDVGFLVEKGIVENSLGGGNIELSTTINSMKSGVSILRQTFYYSGLCAQLNRYCSSLSHKWIADLKQKYFTSPWTSASLFAAVFLLILAITQTICSIISVVN